MIPDVVDGVVRKLAHSVGAKWGVQLFCGFHVTGFYGIVESKLLGVRVVEYFIFALEKQFFRKFS